MAAVSGGVEYRHTASGTGFSSSREVGRIGRKRCKSRRFLLQEQSTGGWLFNWILVKCSTLKIREEVATVKFTSQGFDCHADSFTERIYSEVD